MKNKVSSQGCGPPAGLSYIFLLRLLRKSFPYALCLSIALTCFSRVCLVFLTLCSYYHTYTRTFILCSSHELVALPVRAEASPASI